MLRSQTDWLICNPRFGFRGPPDIILTAKPIVGEKSVNLNKLSSWIEEKLTTEFYREFVIPNMIEKRVSIMCGNYKNISKTTHKKARATVSAVNAKGS